MIYFIYFFTSLGESVSAVITSLWTVVAVLRLFLDDKYFQLWNTFRERELFFIHDIPGYSKPISAIWVVLKMNIDVNINAL